jgi:alpha-L-rhamnosidase
MITKNRLLLSGFLFSAALITVSCRLNQQADITIYEARLNGEEHPRGIDTEKPVFSWKLESEKNNQYQSAYQIVLLDGISGDTTWNSGKVLSDNNILVSCSGSPLKPVTPYTWRVRVWDQDDRSSSWSAENRFSTGPMNENDWQADWISTPDTAYSPVFIKEFNIDKIPGRATAFVNCQGYYELYLNGEKVGNDVLSPAVSDFRFENYYLAHDIRDYLKTGKNTIGLWTGRGWYSPGLPGVIHHSPVFRLQAHLVTGRESSVLISDTSWLTFNSPISQIGNWRWNQMGGELIDGRMPVKVSGEGSAVHEPVNAIRVATPQAVTRSQICRPNVISDTVQVQEIRQIEEEVWLVDFGKNFTGWMSMNIRNQDPGDTIDFIYSDFCNKTPERKSGYQWDFGNNYIDQRDGYICAPTGSGTFSPKFNFHAFRYVIIQGLKNKPLPADIKGFMIESDLDEAGSFTCSDEDLNAIHELNRYTFRCLDIGGYYVDCPHRERLGYGDGQVAIETGIYSFDLHNFYKKWARNWLYAQKADGEIPNTAPSPYDAGGGPAWGGTGVVLPWKIFKYYGDTAFLASSFPSMVRYVDFLESKSRNGILTHYGDETWGFIGDWVPPDRGMDSQDKVGKIEKEVFNNCYKVYLYEILAECAGILGKTSDNEKFARLSRTLKDRINETYFDAGKGIYANGEQPYLSFPLLMNIPPEGETERVAANLENEIRIADRGHLNTGMLGTYFMLQYLSRSGRSDLAYLIMKQKTYPGWGYMISQGATTCWEQWNGYWSNIHSCFTSGGGWFYEGVAGIGQMENSVAFKHLLIIPQLTGPIASQTTEFSSPHGKVLVAWTHPDDDSLKMEIGIPVNTKADLILPVSSGESVVESGKPLTENRNIKIVSENGNQLRIRLTSGRFVFGIQTIGNR